MDNKVTYLDGNMGVTEKIKRAMYDAARQFVYIGFLLWEVEQYGYYKEHGYNNVYEYAEAELNFKKSSTKNFIAICKEYSHSETKQLGPCLSSIGQDISMNIACEYKDFNYSQLTEMLAMSPAQRTLVTPDMTIKEIRDLKKSAVVELKADNYIISEYEIVPEQPQESSSAPGQTSGQKLFITEEEAKYLIWLISEDLSMEDEREPHTKMIRKLLTKITPSA